MARFVSCAAWIAAFAVFALAALARAQNPASTGVYVVVDAFDVTR